MQKPVTFDRHDRATSLIKEKVAAFILHEANSNPLITITNVTISPDYRRVTIFFTTIPDSREADALAFLQRNGTEIRQYLKAHTRLRTIPHLDFSVDYGERHRQHIDSIASDINEKENKSSETIVEELLNAGLDTGADGGSD